MARVILGLGPLLRSRDIAVVDLNAEALGVPRLLLMENAGRAVADEAASRTRPGGRVVVYAGPGGNGGDGLAAARHLALRGYRVEVVLLSKPGEIRSEEAAAMYRALEAMDVSVDVNIVRDISRLEPREADVLIDAMLGVGLRGAPRSPYREAIRAFNESKGLKLAVDVPSGLDADTGEAPGEAVRADVTVTLHKPKPGLYQRPDLVGEIVVAEIGAPPEAEIYVGPGDVAQRVPRRRWDTRKGHGGRVLIVGGSRDYRGAPIIAAMAAERAGVDLVFLASVPSVVDSADRPTLIPVRLEGHPYLHPDHVPVLEKLMARVDAVAVGMGLGLSEDTRLALRMLLERAAELGKPVVLDADGIKHAAVLQSLPTAKLVVTPHDREFEILFGKRPAPVTCIHRRVEDAAEAAAGHPGMVVLLKGPVDVVTDGSRARLNKTGAPSMSAGGTGDALAGLLAALLAKGLDAFDAAAVAAYVNGAAGALAYKERGDSATALDLVEKIPEVLWRPMEHAGEAVVYKRLPLRGTC